VNFLIDAQLPPALARWISGLGPHQAVHAFDLGLHTADDSVLWKYALEHQAVIITKDEDFVDCWLLSNQPAALVWVRKGNCSTQSLLSWFEPLWPDIVKRLEQGERLVELRA
jgi:predicted nuclease of predicted toxin-antitoxin system